MQLNELIHGFRVVNVRHLDEIEADMYEMVHEKTGARTIWLKRDDENKTFSIAFKTTPDDDTGVFHILEHSVLNGSQNYPVKEPFVDLLKGSLQTFLNAMTYPDKTVYPVSSRNDKDFVNLMRIYLDAVFRPLAIRDPLTFYQEGWHYELNEKGAHPIYKGVVFNEMKGAFSSPESIKSRLLMHQLFPDTCYGYESGGDPEHIVELSYEKFCENHRRYYSPSNSYIFLDGDMDIDMILSIIDDEYLSGYSDDGEQIKIAMQEPVVSQIEKEYEISPETDDSNKAHVTYGYVYGRYDDYKKTAAFSLIASVLCGSNESPLKKAILSKGLGEDISFDVQDGILQPYVVIDIINTDAEKKALIDETLKNELERLVKEGLDKEELEANLNQREFKAKERDYWGAPKGLYFSLTALDSWLYGGDPVDSICFGDLFDDLREKISTSYYEDLIREYILDSKHCASITLLPDKTLGEKKMQKEKERLAQIASTWDETVEDGLIEMNRALQLKQASEDTPEQKATLPRLHLEDLKKEPTRYQLDTSDYGGNRVLLHEVNNGISYLTLYAATDDLELEEYTVLTQLLSLLGKLPTERYDILTLNRKMKSVMGDFGCGSMPFSHRNSGKTCHLTSISWSCLDRNEDDALELIDQIIYHTDFSNTRAIRDILKQNLISMEQTFIGAGNALGVQRAMSYSSPVAVIAEYSSGYEAYTRLKKIDEDWDGSSAAYIEKLSNLFRKIFVRERYTLSAAAADKDRLIAKILDSAPHGTVGEATVKSPLGHRREGIIVPANISYAVKGSLLEDDIKDTGIMYLLSNILTFDYLWNNVRVKNGAYGCGFRSGWNRTASFYSYRDPNPANSLDIYAVTPAYLKDFVEKTADIENYIVGTTGEFDPLYSSKTAIRISDTEYLMGVSYQDKQEALNSILNASIEDIRKTIPLFEKINEQDNVCVIGNKEAVERCADRIDTVFDLNSK